MKLQCVSYKMHRGEEESVDQMGEKNMKLACHLLTNGTLVKYAKNEDAGVFVSSPERVKNRKDVE